MENNSREMAIKIAKILDAKKAQQLSVIRVEDVTVLADYFVIATGNSSTQVKGLADEVEFRLKQEGVVPGHVEGHTTRSWIVLDYYDVIVHVFDPAAREYYNLEHLWADGELVDRSLYVTEN